jgi:plasmid stabilization system protein ParE
MARRAARLSPEARKQYLAALRYIGKQSIAGAKKFAAQIREARQTLADYPKIAPAGLIPDTRRFVVKPYILTLRQRRDGVVEIISIRHAKQLDALTPHEALDENETDDPSIDGSFKMP